MYICWIACIVVPWYHFLLELQYSWAIPLSVSFGIKSFVFAFCVSISFGQFESFTSNMDRVFVCKYYRKSLIPFLLIYLQHFVSMIAGAVSWLLDEKRELCFCYMVLLKILSLSPKEKMKNNNENDNNTTNNSNQKERKTIQLTAVVSQKPSHVLFVQAFQQEPNLTTNIQQQFYFHHGHYFKE